MNRVYVLAGMVVALAAVFFAAPTRAEEGQNAIARTAAPPSYHANYLVQITWQPEYLPLNEEVLEALLESSAVQDEPFAKAFGIAYAGDLPEGVDIQAEQLGPQQDVAGARVAIMHLRADIDPDTDAVMPAAADYLRQVCTRLHVALIELSEQSLRPVRMKLAMVDEEVQRARARVEELQQRDQTLRASANQRSLDRDQVLGQMRDMRNQAREFRMQLAMQNARRQAVEKQIAEIAAKSAQQAQADPVLEELKRVVEIRRQQVDRVRALIDQGMAPTDELGDVKERLAMAEMQLADRRQQASMALGQGVLPDLNKQLYQMNVQEAELAARMQATAEDLAEIEPLLELASVYSREVGEELPMAQATLRRARAALVELQRMLRMATPPEVTIIGDEGQSVGETGS